MRKSFRIKKEKDFQQIFNQGQSVANRQFVIYHLSRQGNQHFRVGISVSKRLGNAVVRNRIKRMIRQALTELKSDILTENDFVVIARQPVVDMSVSEVKRSLVHVLSLAKLIKK